jgi:hypothetical protein
VSEPGDSPASPSGPGAPPDGPDVGAGGLPIGGIHAALAVLAGFGALVVGATSGVFALDDDDALAALCALVSSSLWFGAFALVLHAHPIARVAAVVGASAAVCALCGWLPSSW